MAWIKFEKDLLTDPRVLRIARSLEARWKLYESTIAGQGFELGNDEALPAVTLVCGALVRIWSLADTHLGSDDLLPLGMVELDEVVGVPGFCALLPSDWLIEIDEHTVKLPSFHAHNGTEAKKKAVTQKRVARHRQALQTRNASALPDQTKTRPEKTKDKEEVFMLPAWLPKDEWKALLEVRKGKKVQNTPRALKLLLSELERLKSFGHDPARVLDQSTLKSWSSVYPLKPELVSVTAEPASKLCDYCAKVSTGAVNGRRACGEHWPRAMDNEKPAKIAA